jgi:hypothetical protein
MNMKILYFLKKINKFYSIRIFNDDSLKIKYSGAPLAKVLET